jgi:hypothetical protein
MVLGMNLPIPPVQLGLLNFSRSENKDWQKKLAWGREE